MVGKNKPGRRPRGVSKHDMPRASALNQRVYDTNKRAARQEAIMSDEEKTYRDRLVNLADQITALKKRAYFAGREEIQEQLTALEENAQEMVKAPVNYNQTTGAAESAESHEAQTECSFEEPCDTHKAREKETTSA